MKRIIENQAILALVVAIFAMLFMEESTFAIKGSASELVVISHRGAMADTTEHSFEAYDLAINYGSKYIELDLISSQDGSLYVSHDITAILAGSDKEYGNMTDVEIDTLRLENGEKVPTLSSVFDRYGKSVNYVIELRYGTPQAEKFIEVVKSYGLQNFIIAQSYYIDSLQKVKYAFNNMPTMLLSDTSINLDANLKYLEIDIVCMNHLNMTQSNIIAIHNAGKRAFAYTVNTITDLDKLLVWGIDGVFTDYTKEFVDYLGHYNK